MIIGLTLLFIALSVILFHKPPQWAMFLSWFRRDEKPESSRGRTTTDSRKQDTALNGGGLQISSSSVSRPRSSSRSSGETTPKALPQNGAFPVPTFSLNSSDPESDDDEEENLPPPQFPALNSAQRASSTGSSVLVPRTSRYPDPKVQQNGTSTMKPPNQGLMAPPALPSLSFSNSLRIPSTGPIPNRGPAPSASALRPLALAPPPVPNPRKKVLLAPGHSPLDWANLQRTHPNLSGVPRLMRVTPSMLKAHNGRKGKPVWSSYQGKVYNITPYVPFHPGGEGEIRRAAGKDGEKLFLEIHPWVNWDNMLGQCLVGILVSENDPKVSDYNGMDSLD
jgi:cytochrome b involved in lipid metabolism